MFDWLDSTISPNRPNPFSHRHPGAESTGAFAALPGQSLAGLLAPGGEAVDAAGAARPQDRAGQPLGRDRPAQARTRRGQTSLRGGAPQTAGTLRPLPSRAAGATLDADVACVCVVLTGPSRGARGGEGAEGHGACGRDQGAADDAGGARGREGQGAARTGAGAVRPRAGGVLGLARVSRCKGESEACDARD